MRVDSPSGTTRTISATSSTCPVTMCPPSSSPTRMGRSRLTGSPVFQLPSVVFERVSPEAVTANQRSLAFPLSTSVMQTPEQAIEAPMSMAPTSKCVVMTTWVSPRFSMCRTWPTSVTIPVNMAHYLGRRGQAFQHVAAEAPKSGSVKTRRFVQAQRGQRFDRRMSAAAEHGGCRKYLEAVSKAAIEKGRMDTGTTFDEQAGYAPLGQILENEADVGAPARVLWD